MKRTFAIGNGADRKIVAIEVDGDRVVVKQKKGDGSVKRDEKQLASEDAARSFGERMVREVLAKGFVERAAATPQRPMAAPPSAYEDVEAPSPVLPRLAPVVGSEPKPKKKPGGKKKRKKVKAEGELDKRVLGAVGIVGAVCLLFGVYFVYDVFLKPSTVVGTWAGSMIDFEIGQPIVHTQYRLVLDEERRASLTLQERFNSTGTYALKGDRLTLTLKDEPEEEGDEPSTTVREYKVALGRASLDLYDPETGKQLVQLIRFREAPTVKAAAKAPTASKDLAAEAAGEADAEADARLASVEFVAKDGAFKLRHPAGWDHETGGRPDNTYSWITVTKGSAKVRAFADLKGSLISGSDAAGQYEEGSELAPVHVAHEDYRRTAAEEFVDYKETEPTLFKGSLLGEGRLSAFTASTGSVFGSAIRGYRVTLLTNDRRVTLLCESPPKEFESLKPTFLAICRSLSR